MPYTSAHSASKAARGSGSPRSGGRYRGRHSAPRRHPAAPFVLSGLIVASVGSVGLPQAASAFESTPSITGASSAVSSSSTSASSDRDQRLSRSAESDRTALVPSAKVIQGRRLKEKPPPWSLPVRGYHLTARFGQTGLWSSAHTGLDFAAPSGTTIRSIAPGTVVSASYDGAYGNKTVVKLDDGTDLWYCHQTEFDVSAGQRVSAGQVIGSVGSTGHVTGPHLHLEVRPGGGDPIDPEGWLPEHGLNP